MEKIKVVWICHFSNKSVREKLPLSKLRFVNFIKLILGNQNKATYVDFAPWITNQIKEFEKFENVELHIIAPHKGLKKWKYEFEVKGICFHFFKSELSFPFNKFEDKINKNQKREFPKNRTLIKTFINQIKPDLVNLIGTENPYYSIASLDIKDIPVYVSVQTVYTNPNRMELTGNVQQDKWDLELRIHSKERYYGCGGRMHRDLILNNNPKAIIFKYFFPIQKPAKVGEVPKEFDFVFFAAGVTPKKGIEDAIAAINIVKKEKFDVTLNVVGSCSKEYQQQLNSKILHLGLEANISFNGYFPIHSDMHQHIKKGRFALLPVKLDVISGTVIEAMLLDLPVVTYKTSGTPYLNKDGETVLLAEISDIQFLASNMLLLLSNPNLAVKLSKDARAFVEREFDNTKSAERLLNNYRAVIDHYYHDKPIPQDLLFDTTEFPIY